MISNKNRGIKEKGGDETTKTQEKDMSKMFFFDIENSNKVIKMAININQKKGISPQTIVTKEQGTV